MADGRGREQVADLMEFLESYAVTHFSDEQLEMARVRYPGLEAHQRKHEAFITDFVKLKSDLQESGPTGSLTVAVNNRVCRWLVEHVLRADRAFGAFHRRHLGKEEQSGNPGAQA